MTALWTKNDVAHYLHISTRTVDRLAESRLIPFTLVGNRRRFAPADVLEYVASRSFRHRPDLSRPASTI